MISRAKSSGGLTAFSQPESPPARKRLMASLLFLFVALSLGLQGCSDEKHYQGWINDAPPKVQRLYGEIEKYTTNKGAPPKNLADLEAAGHDLSWLNKASFAVPYSQSWPADAFHIKECSLEGRSVRRCVIKVGYRVHPVEQPESIIFTYANGKLVDTQVNR